MNRLKTLSLLSLVAFGASAEVVLPKFFTDNMLVQRDAMLTVAGKATPGAEVKVTTDWANGKAKGKAGADGAFSIALPTPGAGGPYTIIVDDGIGAPVVLSNVLSGELWLCSGQSNMEFPVKGWTQVMNADEVVATARHPEVRLLQIRKNTAYAPQADADVNMGGWVEASPATMDFSAIAYLFAKEMKDSLQVPVGVIDATWGGTPAEAWTSAEYFAGVPGFETEVDALAKDALHPGYLKDDYERRNAQWLEQGATLTDDFDLAAEQTGDSWLSIQIPAMWETSVLPGFDGIVWMQRVVDLPEDAAGKPLTLNLGPIDNEDETYFNGSKVGGEAAWDTPRHYEVPGNLVRAGKNVITVKVSDYGGDGGIGGKPEDDCVVVAGRTYPLAGEWKFSVLKDFSKMPPRPASIYESSFPSVLFNAMISPLRLMPVRGVLWYQGCANVGRAEQYEPMFQNLIRSWRSIWGESLPFYFVQLAGWLQPRNVQPDSEWAALRNAQAKALSLPNTGMAVAIDLGNPADIHPIDKQEVARRLGLIALNRTYGHKQTDAAPAYISSKTKGNTMELKFDGPLISEAGVITGFIVGDGKGKFAYANARLTAPDTVVLSSPLIGNPKTARYNWADCPGGNLTGSTGLPVAPFATDK